MMCDIGDALGERVTRTDLEPFATTEMVHAESASLQAEIAALQAEIAGFEARLFRHLWVMAAGIVGATFTLLKLFP